MKSLYLQSILFGIIYAYEIVAPIKRSVTYIKNLLLSFLRFYKFGAALVTEIPTSTINLLTKIQMEFIWKGKTPNIKSSTLCNDYDNGGLKNVMLFQKL